MEAQPRKPRPPFSGLPPETGNSAGLPLAGRVVIGVAVLLFAAIVLLNASTYVVDPGTRGIKVFLGKAGDEALPEGFGFRLPFVTHIVAVNVKQRTMALKADCFSSDLQQLKLDLRVLFRVPEQSVAQIYKQFAGDAFDSLIAPRVQEALKEVTALQTAEQIVKNREQIKQKTIAAARNKIGEILRVEDIVIRNIDLSDELEHAIETKMVAEQETAKARFVQQQAEIEAQTAVIRAKGDADAIKARGDALKQNPSFLKLQIVDKWNGRSPLVVPADAAGKEVGLLLPLGTHEKPANP